MVSNDIFEVPLLQKVLRPVLPTRSQTRHDADPEKSEFGFGTAISGTKEFDVLPFGVQIQGLMGNNLFWESAPWRLTTESAVLQGVPWTKRECVAHSDRHTCCAICA